MNLLIPKSTRIYCLVDCDSFYASCEVLRNPSLRGKAVCVGRANDIILASSYEAKAHGVKTGTAYRDAIKKLPDAIFIEPDFGRYCSISERLNQLLAGFTHSVEVFSIDETFADITGMAERYHMSYYDFALNLKRKIMKEIGIPTSIGVGRSKTIAKLLSDINKPYGQCDGTDLTSLQHIYQAYGIANICYIGRSSEYKLQPYCTTIQEFANLDWRIVKKELGVSGLKTWYEMNGYDLISFANTNRPKSITRSHSFHPYFLTDSAKVWIRIMSNFNPAYEEMLSHRLGCKYVKLRLRDKGFRSHSRSFVLNGPCDNKKQLLTVIKELFDEAMKAKVSRRTTGVVFGDLKEMQYEQGADLFSYEKSHKDLTIANTILELNKKFGKEVMTTGADILLKTHKVSKSDYQFDYEI